MLFPQNSIIYDIDYIDLYIFVCIDLWNEMVMGTAVKLEDEHPGVLPQKILIVSICCSCQRLIKSLHWLPKTQPILKRHLINWTNLDKISMANIIGQFKANCKGF